MQTEMKRNEVRQRESRGKQRKVSSRIEGEEVGVCE